MGGSPAAVVSLPTKLTPATVLQSAPPAHTPAPLAACSGGADRFRFSRWKIDNAGVGPAGPIVPAVPSSVVIFDFFGTLTPSTPARVWDEHAARSAAPLGNPTQQ